MPIQPILGDFVNIRKAMGGGLVKLGSNVSGQGSAFIRMYYPDDDTTNSYDFGMKLLQNGVLNFTSGPSAPALRISEEHSTDPAAPGANSVILYLKDNGSGKTQLLALFSTGSPQVIATQP